MIDLPFPSKINHSIALRAVNFPLDYFWPIMRLGVPLILLGIAASSLVRRMFAYISPWVESTTNAFGVIISPIPFIVASSIYAVAIHRFILKQEEINLSNVRISANEISYALVIIMFVGMDRIVDVAEMFVAWLSTKPASEFPLVFILNPKLFQYKPMDLMPRPIQGLDLLVRGLLFWLYIRLSLSLPHAAVEGRVSLQTPWKITQGYFWRGIGLITSISILQIPLGYFIFGVFAIVVFCGMYLLGERNFGFLPYLLAVIITPFICMFFAMCIALLSYTYEALRGPA